MSSIKISQLPNLPAISSNTSNSLFLGVDIPSGITGKFTATTLAQQLFANNALVVGNNQILFSNTVGQLSGYDPEFLQVNMQNFNANGSGDYIVTGDKGTNSNNYIDMGLSGSAFQSNPTVGTAFKANDGYLYVQGPGTDGVGNLLIGTGSTNTRVLFAVGGLNTQNVVGYMDKTGVHFPNLDAEIAANLSTSLSFTTSQVSNTNANVIAVLNYTQSAFNTANSANATIVNMAGNVSILQGQVASNANSLIALTGYSQSAYGAVNALVISSNTANLALQLQAAFNLANTNANAAASLLIIDGVQNNTINLVSSVANSAVQNTASITVNNSVSIPGNLTLSSNSVIYGDWSNPVVAYRTALMTSTPNGNTGVYVLPNGSSVSASMQVLNMSNPTNASKILISANGTSNVQIASTRNGSGAYLPMDFNTNGIPQMNLDLAGNLNLYNGQLNAPTVNANNIIVGSNVVASGSGTFGTITISNNIIISSNTAADINIGMLTSTGNVVVNRTSNFSKDVNVSGNLTANGVIVTTSSSGTWTPSISLTGGGTVSYTTQAGNFVRNGKRVTAFFNIVGTVSGGSGNVQLGSFPYAPATGAGPQGVMNFVGPQTTATVGVLNGPISNTAPANIYITYYSGGGAMTNAQLTSALMGTSFSFNGEISYFTN